MPETDDDADAFDFMYHRTLVRHERGTMWIIIILFATTYISKNFIFG